MHLIKKFPFICRKNDKKFLRRKPHCSICSNNTWWTIVKMWDQMKKTSLLGSLRVENKQTRGVSHRGLAIYIKKMYLKAKEEELWTKNSNISPCKKYNFQKILWKKETKILQDIIIRTLFITNLKFQHKPKYHLSKILHIKKKKTYYYYYYRGGQNPLSYYILYNESEHNILALGLGFRV